MRLLRLQSFHAILSARSAQAEERQDEHDDYDQTDEINDAIHGCLLKAGIRCAASLQAGIRRTRPDRGKFRSSYEFGEEAGGWLCRACEAT